jgi:hypothetical protein
MPQDEYSLGGNMVRGLNFEFKPSGAETTSTTHNVAFTGYYGGAVMVTVAIASSSGTTPTLLVTVEGSQDGTTWTQLGQIGANGYVAGTPATAPTNLTGAATVTGIFPRPTFVRTRSTIGGTTPSFTYSVESVIL